MPVSTPSRRVLPRAALLGLATAGCVTAPAMVDRLTRDPVTGHATVPDGVMLTSALVLIGLVTAVAVHRGVPVPAAVLVVPVSAGATMVALVRVALLFGESDGQGGLIVVAAAVVTLLLVPAVGAVAGLTLAIGSAIRRHRSVP